MKNRIFSTVQDAIIAAPGKFKPLGSQVANKLTKIVDKDGNDVKMMNMTDRKQIYTITDVVFIEKPAA